MTDPRQLLNRPATELMRQRVSVRTYSPDPLSVDLQEALRELSREHPPGPFGTSCRFRLLEVAGMNNRQLGTYGIIRGARFFLAGAVAGDRQPSGGSESLGLEDFGYLFEMMILWAVDRGLGTCWLGGFFNRNTFGLEMGVSNQEFMPAISPVGYPSGHQSGIERITRRIVGADNRKPWSELFFDGEFDRPLSRDAAGDLAEALEMVRLAPSASNRQPWRILRDQQNRLHFVLKRSRGYGKSLGFDIQRLDMGIALCHFELAAREMGLKGAWARERPAALPAEEGLRYTASWVGA